MPVQTATECARCERPCDDDVVLSCEACEAPHHLPCWAEDASCVLCGCDESVSRRSKKGRAKSATRKKAKRPRAKRKRVTFDCPECEETCKVPVSKAGGKVSCEHCGERVRVPMVGDRRAGSKGSRQRPSAATTPADLSALPDVRAITLLLFVSALGSAVLALLLMSRSRTMIFGAAFGINAVISSGLGLGLFMLQDWARKTYIAFLIMGITLQLIFIPFALTDPHARPGGMEMAIMVGQLLYGATALVAMLRAAPVFRANKAQLAGAPGMGSAFASPFLYICLLCASPGIYALLTS